MRCRMCGFAKKAVATAFMLSVLPLTALGGIEEEGFYHSNHGYRVKVPIGWKRVDASTFKALEADLPRVLRNVEIPYDVIFYPDSSDAVTAKDFVTVVVSSARIEDRRSGLADAFSSLLDGKKIGDASLGFFSKDEHQLSGANTLALEYRLKGESFNGRIRQYIVSGSKASLLITCTMSGQNLSDARTACESVIGSLDLGTLK